MAPDSAAATPHVLLLPLPFHGHVTPFIELGRRLAASGLHVTLLTSRHVHANLARSQALLQQQPTAPLLSFAYLADGLPEDPLVHEILQATETALEEGGLDFILSRAAEGHPFTCVISDLYLHSSLASQAGLPEFLLVVHSLSMLSSFLQVDALISAGYDPLHTADSSSAGGAGGTGPDPLESIECIAGLPRQHFRYADLPFRDPNKMSLVWHEERIRRRLMQLPSYKGLLVNSCVVLEGEVYSAMAAAAPPPVLLPYPRSLIFMIGPLSVLGAPSKAASTLVEEEGDECMQWLDGQPVGSVLYVAFGTLTRLGGNEQLAELARGLLHSGRRFLWVLREDATSSMSGRSKNSLPLEFSEQVKPGGLGKLVSWAPQVRVLSHPAVGGFFSHCGWNSVLESIYAGVPILGWPFMTDHFPNCRLVSHVWEMGLELNRDPLNKTTSSDVCHGVLELLQGPRALLMRSNACNLRDKLVHGAPDSFVSSLLS